MEASTSRLLSPRAVTQIRRAVLRWFALHARELPWRGTQDLYRIWISEIMLQQTQVITVIDYFQRFTERFANVRQLAEANEAEVLRYWEGLGYYRRARQLHAAAKKIVAEHEGQFPETLEHVLALPGVGRYTAGAILSIGRNQRLPILEANTIRLLSRLTAYRDDPHSSVGQSHLWAVAEQLLPAQQIGAFNQGLMELGALICTPRAPQCEQCPCRTACSAFAAGAQAEIPAPKRKPQIEQVREAALVVRDAEQRVFVRQRGDAERWAGLWDFPRCQPASFELVKLHDTFQQLAGRTLASPRQIAELKHSVTRYRITLEVWEAIAKRAVKSSAEQGEWVSLARLHDLPMNTTGRKIAELLLRNA